MPRKDRERERGREVEELEEQEKLDERVIHIARTAKVVKGGRRFSIRAVVVVGDNKGNVGIGVGKAHEVPDAIRKGSEQARKNMRPVAMVDTTIPHLVIGQHGAASVMLRPASPGTGVIAGGGVRAIIEAAGYKDILTKSLGSANILNVAYATFKALSQLKQVAQVASARGVTAARVLPYWKRRESHV
jgi:small subunit ribosomal protein S5